MAFELPSLPYEKNALEPYMSAQTLEFHHGKHHKAYVDTLNKLIAGTPHEKADLESIVKKSFKNEAEAKIFNNAAQVWNHTFFWNCMKKGGGKPTGQLQERLTQSFGTLDNFAEKFLDAAVTQFGSGWAWLIADGDKLDIVKTPNAVNPLAQGKAALLTCDVWEHAYYLDYQNRRADMVKAFLQHLANWDFVAQNLAKAGSRAAA